MTNDNFPEAPASVTYSVTSKDGFNALFTIRSTSGKDLLETMTVIEKVLGDKGYKPQVKQAFGVKKEKSYVEGKVCPLDNGRLIEKETKQGKKFHECENRKYDFTTKQTSGCTFIDWLEPKEPNLDDIPDFV